MDWNEIITVIMSCITALLGGGFGYQVKKSNKRQIEIEKTKSELAEFKSIVTKDLAIQIENTNKNITEIKKMSEC
ncbi:hypothetical protein [Spiroplasma sp. SV19]|uniref:hypothetical protein n=1 Tax=Spiroplasma sp. SV19 TaxID=2570468 RepID=UPI0024B770D1|nr:hypothetical protein [Spiroplasma sp. SV19]WHQ37188.1 hypothetical protein E7Y35_04775 [Spiroplasma sp. SV19]